MVFYKFINILNNSTMQEACFILPFDIDIAVEKIVMFYHQNH